MKLARCKYNKKTKPDVIAVLDDKGEVAREIDLPTYLNETKREQFLCVTKPEFGRPARAFTAYIMRYLIRHRTLGIEAYYCVNDPNYHVELSLTKLKEFYLLTID